MSSVDDRIVNMQFNNTQFQSGAAASTKSLETLESTIGKMGTSNGMTSMGSSVDGIRAKFSALQVAGVTALATIVNKAVDAGLRLLKSLTIDPILAGFHEYETNLNSIQTIMANTGKSVKIVNSYLQDLNTYSDMTIYSFSQMAEAIGKFTSAGVGLKDATSAIKGMANTAALSGSNVQQLNTAMYQMSQALSTGTIRLMDWNSLANAGMGGENIRNALMATNRTLGDNGKAMDDAIESAGSFRDSLQAGWLSAKTFTKTMKVMSGTTKEVDGVITTVAYSAKQLEKMGFAKDAAKDLSDLSQRAIDSATKVKTFTQLIDVVKESIGSGFAKIFQDLFGTFTEATKMWTAVSTNITTVVGEIFGSVDQMLLGWKALGGYQDLWDGFANIFKTIGNLIDPFVQAFKSMLPATATAGSGLAKITSAFADVTGFIEKLSRGAAVLTPILIAIFSVFQKLSPVIDAVVAGLKPLFSLISDLAGVAGAFVTQGAEIANNLIQGLLEGLDPTAIQNAVTTFANNIVVWIKNALGIHSPAAELVPIGIAIVEGIGLGIAQGLVSLVEAMGTVVAAIFETINDLFSGMNTLDFAAVMNAVLTGGVLLAIRSFAKSATGFLDSFSSPFKQLTATLKSMQSAIKAKIILDIAIAVALLAASIVALSLLDPKQVAVGLGALSALMAELVGALFALSKIKGESLISMAFAISAIAGSMLVLSAAVAILGNLDLLTLGKGLGAIAIGLTIMVVALKSMKGLGKGLPAAAAGIYIMASAMVVMSAAIFALGSMSMGTLAKGMFAIAVGINIMVGALQRMAGLGKGLPAAAAAIFIVASALTVMAGAIAILGKMSLIDLAEGVGAMAFGLNLMISAIQRTAAMGPFAVTGAGAILMIAGAMVAMAVAVRILGQMSIEQLAKGIGAMALALGVFLLAAAGAEVVSVGLEILGSSLFLVGAGLALAGAGMLAFSTGLALLGTVGAAAIGIMVIAIQAFLALLPTIAIQVASAFVVFIETIAAAAPRLREAFGTIFASFLGTIRDAIPRIRDLINTLLGAILNIITNNIPKFGRLLSTMIDTGLRVIVDAIPKMVTAGIKIITGILQGIAEELPKMITAAGDIIAEFIRGVGEQSRKIADAAGDAIVDFLEGIADAIDTHMRDIIAAGLDIGQAIIDGLVEAVGDAGQEFIDAITGLAGDAWDAAKDFFGIGSPSRLFYDVGVSIVDGMTNGVNEHSSEAVNAVVEMAKKAVKEGNDAIDQAQKAARKKRHAALVAQARADVAADIAKDAEKAAKQNPKNKALQKAADEARRAADEAQKAADQAERDAAGAGKKVDRLKTFDKADAEGKGDILTAQSKALQQRAKEALAKANAEARAAKDLTGQARKDMLKAAREDAAAAKRLAEQSRRAMEKADEFYARSIKQRIAALIKARREEERAQQRQEEFAALTTQEQSDLLTKRAEKHEAQSERAQQQADDLLQRAKKLAEKNPEKAERLLKRAERKAREAERAADKAQEERDQAQQLADSASTGGVPGLTLSHTALEDAAKAIDRYTESLLEAETAAGAEQGPTFVQNNYSPEALSPSTVYRSTKNLLTAQEIKMAVGTKTPR